MKTAPSLTAAGLAALLSVGAAGYAQDYPTRPVRILASEAGSNGDFFARTAAQGLTSAFGQQVLVDNRGGGVVAGDVVARSAPDGYTLLVYGDTLWLLPLMRKEVPYDTQRDFLPITLMSRAVNVLVVHPSLPVKNVKELVALAKARPGQLNFSTAAPGTMNHLAGEMFKSMAKINIVRIGYRGSPSALNAVLSGEVQMMFATSTPSRPHILSGKLRPLAVSTATRSSLYPELPTIAEAGVPGFEAISTHGLFAPAKTPDAIITRLNQEVVRILQRSETKDRFAAIGGEPAPNTPQQMAAYIKSEIARFGKVIQDAKIEER
jgi:tripartite-type tricarboxylate transporter receptor subunit TctC